MQFDYGNRFTRIKSKNKDVTMNGKALPKTRWMAGFDRERGKVGWAHWRTRKKQATAQIRRRILDKQIIADQLESEMPKELYELYVDYCANCSEEHTYMSMAPCSNCGGTTFTKKPHDEQIPESCDRHTKYDGSWWAKDAQGIELARVCDLCEKEKLSRYCPEILTGYTQADVDEPIEPEL